MEKLSVENSKTIVGGEHYVPQFKLWCKYRHCSKKYKETHYKTGNKLYHVCSMGPR
ncbi:hypothetical protein KIMC2_02360 [Xylocopilactobacillus apis]|uniref:Uncharacterized protein n=1 Tax=Xylocopilactobacillus apis TaxID=2932183 RepID=A0AAU9CWE3_9LACO|nr:hypothetical protein KIMC2_02360 [Xylocopilactobacillus apis]